MNEKELIQEINRLKKEKNAIILAHGYQIPEIQEIADILGDSFMLSKEAAKTDADMIVFCGVHFMAESAKILSPNKKVLLPVLDAGCPMADMITGEQLRIFKQQYPNASVVCYVNSTAEVKAESDVCCTSSNAVKVIKHIQSDQILFVPDKNLGNYIQKQVPEKEIITWDGFCPTHHRVEIVDIENTRKEYPDAFIVAHPECQLQVLEKADFVGSTSQIIDYIKNSSHKSFVIGTEMGIMHQLKKENKEKEFHLLSTGLVCFNMKKIGLIDVYNTLKYEKNEIQVDEDIRKKAFISLERMLEIQ